MFLRGAHNGSFNPNPIELNRLARAATDAKTNLFCGELFERR